MKQNFTRLIIKNPVSLKLSIFDMLAIIKPYITSYQLDSINYFIRQLPDTKRSMPINIITDCRIDLISAISILQKIDSSLGLRSEITNELIEFETQLRKAYLIRYTGSAPIIL